MGNPRQDASFLAAKDRVVDEEKVVNVEKTITRRRRVGDVTYEVEFRSTTGQEEPI